MKATEANVAFEEYNQYNVFVTVSHISHERLIEALELLIEELPSELSFYVPESHHKRIIGHGGKNIQRIMKKYGVYVKFLNSSDVQELYGLSIRKPVCLLNNVIVRTPSKNSQSLLLMKTAVLEASEEEVIIINVL
ncbi:hypothetical protein ROZALSC1DRAFT_27479 [Rozella allomycis CSF55]|uniref:K Homology domain-containing protein n=1 Tax=Rozella allomycis (strain CSF55) TaxID=988480 RepID=A0A4P9YP88_ROZAC|nr:hypothetical protein ROZALSC1DRAFT_27479 [Rozella allomycis CSF55]